MCTLSVITLPRHGGFRVVMNRDELRTRGAESPPAWKNLPKGLRAIWPGDADAHGTWIAARPVKPADEHGPRAPALIVAVTNVNPEPPPPKPARPKTRGLLVPGVIGCADAHAAIGLATSMELDRFAPFRMVAIDGEDSPMGEDRPRIFWMTWDGRHVVRARHNDPSACFVSSGLGDSKVNDRLDLFAELVAAAPGAMAQDRFHRHCWPNRPEASVLMTRADARTVSITTIEVRAGQVTMDHELVPDRR